MILIFNILQINILKKIFNYEQLSNYLRVKFIIIYERKCFMKEIVILNKGDNINKLSLSMAGLKNLKPSQDRILGYRYVEMASGNDDIIVVKNYQPYFVNELTEENTLLDWYARGYNVVGMDDNLGNHDTVVLKKIEGVKYVVSPLEKLEDIARKLGVDKQEIIEKNSLKTEKLFVGQVLIV